jgi:hypothetical protein
MSPTPTSSFLLPSWASTTLRPHAHGTRPCGPCRGHSFQLETPGHVPMVTLCPAHGPDSDASQAARLTTRSRPHGSSRPTRVPALTRTNTVTSPQPGPAPRHLPDSDASDLHDSPSASRSTRLRPHGARLPLTPWPRAQRRRAHAIRKLCQNGTGQAQRSAQIYDMDATTTSQQGACPTQSQRVSGQPPPALAVCIPHSTHAVCT